MYRFLGMICRLDMGGFHKAAYSGKNFILDVPIALVTLNTLKAVIGLRRQNIPWTLIDARFTNNNQWIYINTLLAAKRRAWKTVLGRIRCKRYSMIYYFLD